MTAPSGWEQDEARFAPDSLLVDSTGPISISPLQYQLHESLHSNNILIKPSPTPQTLKQAPPIQMHTSRQRHFQEPKTPPLSLRACSSLPHRSKDPMRDPAIHHSPFKSAPTLPISFIHELSISASTPRCLYFSNQALPYSQLTLPYPYLFPYIPIPFRIRVRSKNTNYTLHTQEGQNLQISISFCSISALARALLNTGIQRIPNPLPLLSTRT